MSPNICHFSYSFFSYSFYLECRQFYIYIIMHAFEAIQITKFDYSMNLIE